MDSNSSSCSDDKHDGRDYDDYLAEPYCEEGPTQNVRPIAPQKKIFHETTTKRQALDQNISFSEVLDVPEDGCLLRTLFAGLKLANNSSENDFLPGNEIVGCILSIGIKVPTSSGFKVGDEVLVIPKQGCKQCETCSSANNWHFCDRPEPSFSSVVDLTDDNLHTRVLSGLYAIHDWRSLVKMPKEIPGHVCCMLSGNALCMYSAILEAKSYFQKSTRLRGFSNLLLICGGDNTGGSELYHFWCLYYLKNIFCDANIKVVLASYLKSIINVAPSLESDDAILLLDNQNMAGAVTMQGCNKMDVVIDAIGSQETFELALSCLSNGGLLTLIRAKTSTQTVSVEVQKLLNRSLTIKSVGSCSKELLKDFLDILSVQGVWYNFVSHLKILSNREFCSNLDQIAQSEQLSNKCKKIIVKFEP